MPFVIAANGPRSLRLAARLGQGWVTYGRGGDTSRSGGTVSRLGGPLDAAEAAAGRASAAGPLPLLDAVAAVLAGVGRLFEEMVGRAAELGFTDVVTHWPRPESPYAGDERVLREVASRL